MVATMTWDNVWHMVGTQSVWKKGREVNEGTRKEEKEEEGQERKKFQKYASRVYNLLNQRIQMPNHHGIGLSLKRGAQEPTKFILQMEKTDWSKPPQ